MSKAPDKIYLAVDKNENWKYAIWTARCPQEQKFSELDKHEEYIRKDALLEWAKEGLDKTTKLADGGVFEGERIVFQCLVNKLESL